MGEGGGRVRTGTSLGCILRLKATTNVSNNLSSKVAVNSTNCRYILDKRADVLQKVEVRVVTNAVCDEWYASQGKSFSVETKQMCAGWEEGGKDSCWVSEKGVHCKFIFRSRETFAFLRCRIVARSAPLVNRPIMEFMVRRAGTTRISINTHATVVMRIQCCSGMIANHAG